MTRRNQRAATEIPSPRRVSGQSTPAAGTTTTHGGVLRNNNNNEGVYDNRPERHVFDASVGVAIDFDQFSVQLSWVGISSANAPYPVTGLTSRNRAVLILSRSF